MGHVPDTWQDSILWNVPTLGVLHQAWNHEQLYSM